MTILGIETSCDETSTGIVEKKNGELKLLSHVVSSSLSLHSRTGGIIPEIAAREQIKLIIPVIEQALENCKLKIENLDSIAVTYGPGLLGSLLVGVETAKTLNYVFNKPLIPINHLLGHIYANFIGEIHNSEWLRAGLIHNSAVEIKFPAIALIVSGGHTDLLLMKKHGSFKWLGGTRDDAAGEAFDKIGRLLGLPYPGGPAIEKASLTGDPKKFKFPRPMIESDDFDFSFSGLKTAVLREIERGVTPEEGLPTTRISVFREGALAGGKLAAGPRVNDISASVQQAIIDVLVQKTLQAARLFKVKSILLGGGVAANQKLRDELKLNAEIFVPQKSLCTDNGAMIAAAAFFNFESIRWNKLSANPQLYF